MIKVVSKDIADIVRMVYLDPRVAYSHKRQRAVRELTEHNALYDTNDLSTIDISEQHLVAVRGLRARGDIISLEDHNKKVDDEKAREDELTQEQIETAFQQGLSRLSKTELEDIIFELYQETGPQIMLAYMKNNDMPLPE